MKGLENVVVGDSIVSVDSAKEYTMTLKSEPIVVKTKKLSDDWTFKERRMVNGIAVEKYYYETVDMSKYVKRYYARDTLTGEYTKKYTKKVMDWLRNKLSDPQYTILREGSNFFDVIWTEKLKEINK